MFHIYKGISLIISYTRQYLGILFAFIAFYLIRKNINLVKEKKELKKELETNDKINKAQDEIIKKISSINDVDLDSNIKRMRDKDL